MDDLERAALRTRHEARNGRGMPRRTASLVALGIQRRGDGADRRARGAQGAQPPGESPADLVRLELEEAREIGAADQATAAGLHAGQSADRDPVWDCARTRARSMRGLGEREQW
jgi:hypothetical protein